MKLKARKEGNEYVKAMLYAYPHLRGLSEALLQSAENKALLSYKKDDALAAAQCVAEELFLRDAIEGAVRDMQEVLERLNEWERRLLDYKYFHRTAQVCAVDCSERTYYRKQRALVSKTGALLRAKGWTEERFLKEFKTSVFFMRVYKAVCEGKERELVGKRKKKTLFTDQTKSSLSSGRTGR